MPQKSASFKRGKVKAKSQSKTSTDEPAVKKKKVIKDENFPRGGGVWKIQDSSDQSSSQNIANPDAELFKEVDEQHKSLQSRRKKKEEAKKSKAQQKPRVPILVDNQPEPHLLTRQILAPGMLVLGCVKEVHEYNLIISLPNNLSGTVALTQISPAYTQQLQRLTQLSEEDVANEETDVADLHTLFKVGTIVPCKVLSVQTTKQSGVKINLSLNPADINRDLTSESLHNGMSIFGSISSVEDRGYVVDLGIRGVKTFMKSLDAEKFIQLHNEGYSLKVGQPVYCGLKLGEDRMERVAGDTRTVNVMIDPVEVSVSQLKGEMDVKFNNLVPGMRVAARVTKVCDNGGVVVKFLSFKGSIPVTHLSSRSPTKGDQLKASILYIHPTTKAVVLTTLPHILDYGGVPQNTALTQYDKGDIVEEARVLYTDLKRGVYFRVEDGVTALASPKNLSDEKNSDMKVNFKRGTVHRCRVLGVDWMDNVVHVGLKKSLFSKSFLSLKSLHPGDLLECEVVELRDKGAIVKAGNISGIIPSMHLADIPLKMPEKKFTSGCKIKCRILKNDLVKKSLVLTAKKSLIHTQLPLLTDFAQLEKGLQVEGYIIKTYSKGVLVGFYDNVKGFVPKKELSTEEISHPEKVFYTGQVVKCLVLDWNTEKGTLTLSFKSDDWEQHGSRLADVPEDFQIGKTVDCKVRQKSKTGLDVVIGTSGVSAFLPRIHLSDSKATCDLQMEVIKPDSVLRNCVYLSHSSVLILSRRKSIVDYFKENVVVTNITDLKDGMLIPGTVKSIHPRYGIFVELPAGLVGLAPNRYVSDRQWQRAKEQYYTGQAVIARILQTNAQDNKCLVSLRMQECYQGNTDASIVEEYLLALDILCKHGGKTSMFAPDIEIGDICTAFYLGRSDDKIVYKLTDHGLTAKCPLDLMDDEDDDNMSSVEVAVLNFNTKDTSVDVVSNKEVVTAIKEKLQTKGKVHQKVKGKVLLICDEVTVVILQGSLRGQVAHIPTKKHLNDVLGPSFSVAQQLTISIQKIFNGHVVGVLDYPPHRQTNRQTVDGLDFENGKFNLDPGNVVEGRLQKLKKRSGILVNLVGGAKGIVCLTDLFDEYQNDPLTYFKQGQHLKCYVIDLGPRQTYQLSLRKSRITNDKSDVKDPEVLGVKSIRVGQVVRGYIIKKTSSDILVRIGRDLFGTIDGADFSQIDRRTKRLLFNGKIVISAKITSLEGDKVKMKFLSYKKDETKGKTIKRQHSMNSVDSEDSRKVNSEGDSEDESEKQPRKKKTKKMRENNESDILTEESHNNTRDRLSELPSLKIDQAFSWDADLTLPPTDGAGSSSDETDTEENLRKPQKSKKDKKKEECMLFEFEKKQLEGVVQPEKADDFERLVLQSPDSSLVWIRYMAYHLESSEIEKAQAVAERALKTISFREEQERLNVWVAYLNLENMYGTPAQLQKVLERAVQQNEPLNVYQQLVSIYIKSGKLEEAEQLYSKMVKKHSANKSVWLGFGEFLFRNGRAESARKLLQRSLNSLEKRDHVETISKFAQMEFKYGDAERGKTMFENILVNYPRRTDLWSIYIDMVVKVGDIEGARLLFERVINLQMAMKKMKFFFKKFLDFEEKHGDEFTVASVKQKAQEYVDSH
ncbi:protein RRP5 homolog [Saccostrea echinata]|uniref:protein RRP5 homolog n=1 Tax=Saccostrea echinata TaxID=191078 RepID=UPI002A7EB183|nr:protein RRP5 homolog [Saccostrea echinata]